MLRDVVIVGGGHNGLVCAAYLAGAGLSVTILERRHIIGGAAVTEEFHPGFRNSIASYAVSLLNPKIIQDLELQRFGLHVVRRRLETFLPLHDGGYLKIGAGRTATEVAKFSSKDAGRLEAYEQRLSAIVQILRELMLQSPPNMTWSGWRLALPELLRSVRWRRRLARIDLSTRHQFFDLLNQSAGDFLDGWFESAPVKAAYGFPAIAGHYASPYSSGSAYVLLHHAFGQVHGVRGAWGHVIGGMGSITQAMARAAERRGVEIRLSSPVREVTIAGGRAVGIVMESGQTIRARCIVSNVNPQSLYGGLIDSSSVAPEFRDHMTRWRAGSGTFRMNVALAELPSFSVLPGRTLDEHHTAGIITAPSLAYMDQAYADARQFGWSRHPVVQMVIPSTLDGSLAPPGRHVASLFCQHVAPVLPDGSSWDEHRERVADLIIDHVDGFAPNFKSSVIGRQVMSPLDLERTFGLVNGDIFHGAMSLEQMFSARPMLGYAKYRGALKSLYLCGSGAHPGGGVTGAAGHNCAQAILADLRMRRLSRRLGWRS